jgi:hypothetical protein
MKSRKTCRTWNATELQIGRSVECDAGLSWLRNGIYWDVIGGKEGILIKIPCWGGGGERMDILNPLLPPLTKKFCD